MLEHLLESFIKTGWVLGPLMAASLVGWFMIFHRWMTLQRLDWKRFEECRRAIHGENFGAWIESLSARDRRSTAGNAAAEVYAMRKYGRKEMENKLDEVMKMHVPELERFLSTVAILASAAPLIGLLGTVSGMVKTFEVISAFGTGNTALMSDSIAESLLATQNGLLVAFPLMMTHLFLASKAVAIESKSLSMAKIIINRYAGAANA